MIFFTFDPEQPLGPHEVAVSSSSHRLEQALIETLGFGTPAFDIRAAYTIAVASGVPIMVNFATRPKHNPPIALVNQFGYSIVDEGGKIIIEEGNNPYLGVVDPAKGLPLDHIRKLAMDALQQIWESPDLFESELNGNLYDR